MVDAAERLEVLLQQEASHYLTEDYLSKIRIKEVVDEGDVSPSSNKKRKSLSGAVDNNIDETPLGATVPNQGGGEESLSSQINKQWREKICEWAYQGRYRVICVPIANSCELEFETIVTDDVRI